MIGRMVAAAGVCGALVLGGAGAAWGATGASAGPTTAGPCAHAQTRLDRLATQQGALASRIARLQAAQTKAAQAGHAKLARRIGRRITLATRRRSRDERLTARIEARCPGTTPQATTTPSATSAD